MLIRVTFLLALWPATAFAGGAPGAIWSDYAADGWHEIGAAAGDLNRDGRDDAVVVIEAPDGVIVPANACEGDPGYSDAPVRRLIVAFADGNGGYTRAADEPRLVLRADEGGVFGDPFESVAIEHGSVVVYHYGGSRWRWGQTLRFRFDDGDWRMTGMTDSQMDSLSLAGVTYDYNALTGKVEVVVDGPAPDAGVDDPVCVACRTGEQCPEANGCYAGTRPGKPGKTLHAVGKKDRVLLSDFRCWFDRTGLLAHTGFQTMR